MKGNRVNERLLDIERGARTFENQEVGELKALGRMASTTDIGEGNQDEGHTVQELPVVVLLVVLLLLLESNQVSSKPQNNATSKEMR